MIPPMSSAQIPETVPVWRLPPATRTMRQDATTYPDISSLLAPLRVLLVGALPAAKEVSQAEALLLILGWKSEPL